MSKQAVVRSGTQLAISVEASLENAVKAAKGHSKTAYELLTNWLSVNHSEVKLTAEQKLHVLKILQQETHQTADKLWQTMASIVGPPLAENALYADDLKKQVKELMTGNQLKVNEWIEHFVVLQYVPSTIFTILTTLWINEELQKAHKLSKKEAKMLNNQEIARQVVGASIHFAQAYGSFGLVNGIALAGKHSPTVRKQAVQWIEKTAGWQGFNKTVGKGLHKIADVLQWAWNNLSNTNTKTGVSLAFVMFSNVLSYGMMRPLLVNTTFLGINEATVAKTPTESNRRPVQSNQ
jgi:hypothetical protein